MKARALYQAVEEDDRSTWELAADPGAAFDPRDSGKVAAWLRLAASTPNAGEYDAIVDTLASNPTNQADTDRKPAASTAANGLPIATWDATDILVWPLASNNNQTTKFGIACWVNFASVASTNMLYARFNGANGSTQRVIETGVKATGVMFTDVWISTAGGTGRTINSAASTVSASAWHHFYMAYDSSLGGDGNVMHFLDGAAVTLGSPANIGAGGTIGVLQAATGNAFLGAQSDSDTPAAPLSNGTLTGPNFFILNDTLTLAELAALMNFEKPT